jgi:nitrogen fixation-related uncharacterized protein
VSGYLQDRTGFGPLFAAAIALYGLSGVLFYWAGKQKQMEVEVRTKKEA